jgi:hypothetical protein
MRIFKWFFEMNLIFYWENFSFLIMFLSKSLTKLISSKSNSGKILILEFQLSQANIGSQVLDQKTSHFEWFLIMFLPNEIYQDRTFKDVRNIGPTKTKFFRKKNAKKCHSFARKYCFIYLQNQIFIINYSYIQILYPQ